MLHASQPTRRSLSSFSGAASLIPCSALQAKTWLAWTKQAESPALPENIEEPSSGAPGPILQSLAARILKSACTQARSREAAATVASRVPTWLGLPMPERADALAAFLHQSE